MTWEQKHREIGCVHPEGCLQCSWCGMFVRPTDSSEANDSNLVGELPSPSRVATYIAELKRTGDEDGPALASMMLLYELHAENAHARAVLAEYEACIVQLNRSANELAVHGEARWAEAFESRARDLLRQAKRHAANITNRPKEPQHAETLTKPR